MTKGKRRGARDGWLRARWSPELVEEFSRRAAGEGRKAPEVLRELAAGFLRQAEASRQPIETQ